MQRAQVRLLFQLPDDGVTADLPVNAQGDTLTCVDLRAGDQAMVQGSVNPDGTFGDAAVVVR